MADAKSLIPISKAKAIQALNDIEERHFECDKGSSEMYQDWAADIGLCEHWDPEEEVTEEGVMDSAPPSFLELLVAAGVDPDEIIHALKINPRCFPPEMRRLYAEG